jgi:hypothetical protein
VPVEGYVGIGSYAGQGCLYKDLYIEHIDDDGNVIDDEEELPVEEEPEIPEAPVEKPAVKPKPSKVKPTPPAPVMVPVIIN